MCNYKDEEFRRSKGRLFLCLSSEERATNLPEEEEYRYGDQVWPDYTESVEHGTDTEIESSTEKRFECAGCYNHITFLLLC